MELATEKACGWLSANIAGELPHCELLACILNSFSEIKGLKFNLVLCEVLRCKSGGRQEVCSLFLYWEACSCSVSPSLVIKGVISSSTNLLQRLFSLGPCE